MRPYFGLSPSAMARQKRTPVSFASNSMLPSRYRYQKSAVVVVPHGVEGGNHQTPRATDLRGPGLQIAVSPEHTVVFFVHADRVGVVHHFAIAVHHVGVEVEDLADAVATQAQRIDAGSETDLAEVEGMVAVVIAVGLRVGHHQLAQGCAVDHGTSPRFVPEAHSVQHEPFTVGEADPERPVLPGDRVAFDAEIRPFGLSDLETGERRANPRLRLGPEAARVRREGKRSAILDPKHLLLQHVDHRDEPLDRPHVGIVSRILDIVGVRSVEASGPLLFRAEIGGEEPFDDHFVQIDDAAPAKPFHVLRMRLDEVLDLFHLLRERPDLHAFHVFPGQYAVLGQRGNGFKGASGRPVEHHHERLAGEELSGGEGANHILGRLVQRDRLEERIRIPSQLPAHQRHGMFEFLRTQGIERVGGGVEGGVVVSCTHLGHRNSPALG